MCDIQHLGYKYAGPVLLSYVQWILNMSIQMGISRIYFLARDGYTLLQIAQKLCDRYSIDIECRYLYCSRLSLRIPTYHFIGNEAYEIMSISSTRNTVYSVFEHVNVSHEEADNILDKAGIVKTNKILSNYEYKRLCQKLFDNDDFKKCVDKQSKSAYTDTIGYLRQEGLFENISFAVADSGWTGSMQRSLRQLLESAGYSGTLLGFYFGMFCQQKEREDGNYYTMYFNSHGSITDKIFFCNNLFECWLSAPHGMTIGYKKETERYIPVTMPEPSENEKLLILEHCKGIDEYISSCSDDELNPCFFDEKKTLNKIRKLLWKIMSRPTVLEAECYGKFIFCDDTSEKYSFPLASKEQIDQLKNYSVIHRLFGKLLHKSPENRSPRLFWTYGTIAFVPGWKKWWYMLNVITWEFMRFILKMLVNKGVMR